MPPDDGDPIVWFLDRSLGAVQVASALIAEGEEVVIHDDRFLSTAEDPEWLPVVGRNGWVALSKDDQLRFNPLQRLAIYSAAVPVFILAQGNLTGAQMAEAFVAALPAMKRFVRRMERPFIVTVMRNGDLHVKMTAADLHRICGRK